jgi:hypothetical protein
MRDDEFYIGYEPGVPAGMAHRLRRAVPVLIAVLLVAAGVATLTQRPLPAATFDYGRPQPARGWLTLRPMPTLQVRNGNRSTRYWLVGRGKFGAEADLAGFTDGWVSLEGTEIARDHWRMLEIVPGSVRPVASPEPPPVEVPIARIAFQGRGEIVDAKCFLGVMNPGQGAAHRDCAARCLSGGVPMMFAYRDANGESHLALLLSARAGMPGPEWKQLAGTSADIRGELLVRGDEEVLVVEPR